MPAKCPFPNGAPDRRSGIESAAMRSFHARPLLLSCALALLCSPPVARASTSIDLNGPWLFRIQGVSEGEATGWPQAVPAGTEMVRVPHTWNVGAHADHEGKGWYFRSFALPAELLDKHVEIRFGATFYKSRVWLNGQPLGGHEGGHTAYVLDATGRAKAENLLVVELDNRPGVATIPGWARRLDATHDSWYDWWHYGGIVRDVAVVVSDTGLIRRQRIRSRVEQDAATVSDTVVLEGHGPAPHPARLSLVAWDPSGEVAARAEQAVSLAAGAQEVAVELRLQAVKLWRLDDPQLYRLEARLLDEDGRLLDSGSDTFGLRTIAIRDRKLYVNGEHVRLTGLTRHEDSPWEGLAESAGTIAYDYDDLKALNVNLTRPVHYPQHPLVLDYADRHGILLMPEIPIWQFSEAQLLDPQVRALARQMMKEMIEQAGNHPSVMAWSVCNESETFKPGGVSYVEEMKAFIRTLDPDRFVTYADDSAIHSDDPTATAAVLADFVMVNEYFGSWTGSAAPFAGKLEKLGRLLPDKMVVISEFGLAGLFAPDSEAGDRRRIEIMRAQMAEFMKHDWIAGALFWCYADYKSHRNLWPGRTTGYVDHGLVDEYRQRRPSYRVWKELTAPARLAVDWNQTYAAPTAFRLTVTPRGEGEIPYLPLRGYRVEWLVRGADGGVVAQGTEALDRVDAARDVEGKIPETTNTAMTLEVRLLEPGGRAAVEATLPWWQPRPGQQIGVH